MRTTIGVSLVLACVAGAQQPQPAPGVSGAQAELDAAFARPAGTTIDAEEALAKLSAFFEHHPDPGPLGYAKALASYLRRDYARAAVDLDEFFTHYDTIANDEHRGMAGRIYLNALMRGARDDVDADKLVHYAGRAAELYPEPVPVVRLVQRVAADADATLAMRLRLAVAQHLLAGAADEADKDKALATLYASVGDAAGPRPAARSEPQAPPTLTPFRATAMSGDTIDLGDYRGKVVLVDFWATWCPPCMAELPNVVKAYQARHADGFEVIGISLDGADAEDKIHEVTERLGMPWPQIYDGGGWDARLAKENGIHAIPAPFLLDRKGTVRYAGSDARGEALEKHLDQLLHEQP